MKTSMIQSKQSLGIAFPRQIKMAVVTKISNNGTLGKPHIRYLPIVVDKEFDVFCQSLQLCKVYLQ